MRKSRWTESYAHFESWVFGGQQDAAAFAAAMKLMDLEDQTVRIKTEDQRRFFGYTPFGKRKVRVSSRTQPSAHDICVTHKVCFGQDFDEVCFSWSLFQELLNQRRKVM